MTPHVLADGTDGLRPRKIAHDGNDQVTAVKIFEIAELLFGTEITQLLTLLIGLCHQVPIRGTLAAATKTCEGRARRVVDGRAIEVERAIGACHAVLVV